MGFKSVLLTLFCILGANISLADVVQEVAPEEIEVFNPSSITDSYSVYLSGRLISKSWGYYGNFNVGHIRTQQFLACMTDQKLKVTISNDGRTVTANVVSPEKVNVAGANTISVDLFLVEIVGDDYLLYSKCPHMVLQMNLLSPAILNRMIVKGMRTATIKISNRFDWGSFDVKLKDLY